MKSRIQDMYDTKSIRLDGHHRISFDPAKQLVFNYFQSLPQHPNGMRLTVYDKDATLIATNEYFSIGGGFVVNDKTQLAHGENVYYKNIKRSKALASRREQDSAVVALPFRNAEELLATCREKKMTIAQVVFENELNWHSADEIRTKLLTIWNTMDESIKNGVMASSIGKEKKILQK